jgi:DNA-binding XRE family transcriptional regulator
MPAMNLIYIMPKQSNAIVTMPSVVQNSLRELGENLSIARERRRELIKVWAQRIGVSEPTLKRMENGDPSVSMGVYSTALWLIGRHQALTDLAAPEHDLGALESSVRKAQASGARKKPSIYGDAMVNSFIFEADTKVT